MSAQPAATAPDSYQMIQSPEAFRDIISRILVQHLVTPLQQNNYDADRYSINGKDNSAAFQIGEHQKYLQFFFDHWRELFATYRLLEDSRSKRLFIELIAFRAMGHLKFKLLTNTPEHWAERKKIHSFKHEPSTLAVKGMFGELRHVHIPFMGTEILMDAPLAGLPWAFILKQYFYEHNGVSICPSAGDHVVDAGACMGDTTLAFAAAVGEKGAVYAFDFMPANLTVARHNIAQNPVLAPRISLFPFALANDCKNINAVISDQGIINPAASLLSKGVAESVPTTTIDQLVAEGKIARVDFIKMDIEGSELPALKGAEQAIRRFKPKLAISLYHTYEDFYTIPAYIHSLGLGYAFYLDHYTIHQEETVLYARVP